MSHSSFTGYIDLSKRRVSPEDIVKCEERYTKSKTVASIMRHVASKVAGGPVVDEHGDDEAHAASGNDEERLEALYDQFAWPLAKKYGHTYDAFKLALTEPDVVFEGLDIPPATLQHLTSTIGRRLTPQPIKMRADIELSCFTPAGIDAIKRALRAGETASTEAVPIKAKLVAPPLYVLTTNATDKYGAVDRLERAIELIQATIEEDGGDLVVKMKVRVLNDFFKLALADDGLLSPRLCPRRKRWTSPTLCKRRARRMRRCLETRTRRTTCSLRTFHLSWHSFRTHCVSTAFAVNAE